MNEITCMECGEERPESVALSGHCEDCCTDYYDRIMRRDGYEVNPDIETTVLDVRTWGRNI